MLFKEGQSTSICINHQLMKGELRSLYIRMYSSIEHDRRINLSMKVKSGFQIGCGTDNNRLLRKGSP